MRSTWAKKEDVTTTSRATSLAVRPAAESAPVARVRVALTASSVRMLGRRTGVPHRVGEGVLQWGVVEGRDVIQLEVPGIIGYRDVVLRTLSAVCKLAIGANAEKTAADGFSAHVVSAVGEAYNNIALHGYRDREPGVIRVEMEIGETWIRVVLRDFGASFDLTAVEDPDLSTLPESGLGVFIIKSFVDDVAYTPGHPNTMTLFKRLQASL